MVIGPVVSVATVAQLVERTSPVAAARAIAQIHPPGVLMPRVMSVLALRSGG